MTSRRKALARVGALAISIVAAGLAPLTATGTATAASEFGGQGEQANVHFTPWDTSVFAPDESPTASKPQSKLWWARGSWWAVMLSDTTGNTFHIWKYDGVKHTWSDTGTQVDDTQRSRIDTLWDGTHLFTVGAAEQGGAAAPGRAIRFTRFSYNATTGKYVSDAGFPKTLNNDGVEAAVLSKDGHNRLWVAYTAPGTGSGTVPASTAVKNVRYLTSDNLGNTWSATEQALPFPESQNLNDDDIATVQGSSDGASIAWSRQDPTNATSNQAFYVATYRWSTRQWSLKTVASAQYAADDHLNMSLDGDGSGRLFMVVKTSANDQPSTPSGGALLELWVLATDGNWASHPINTVGEGGTRPIVVIDRDAGLLRVFFTTRETGGDIVEKTTSLASPGIFSAARPVISVASSPAVNNVTTTKQNVTAGTPMMILASDQTTGDYVDNYATGAITGGGGTGGGGTPSSGPTVAITGAGSYYAPSRMVTARWSATADHYRVTKSVIGTGRTAKWHTTVVRTAKAGISFEGTPGNTYCMQVTGVTKAGATGKPSAFRCVAVPLDDRQLAMRGAWQRISSKGAYLRTLLKSTWRGASVTRKVTGKNVSLVVTKLPRGGTISVFQGKRLVKRVSLAAKRTKPKQLITIANRSNAFTARYRVVVTTQGRPVIIDGLAVTRK